MKAFAIFNSCVLLGWFVWYALAKSDMGPICFLILALPALALIDVTWLIVLAVVGRRRQQARLSGEHDPAQGRTDGKKDSAAKRPPVGWDMPALTTYMRQAAAHGMSHDQITAQLRRNGWSDAEIQKARQIAHS
ncbi:MAG: hypothetical protein HQ581_12840 [Planctomycetes bacterium]|nr:hypothetical protein [Planctomycetota bacterium]